MDKATAILNLASAAVSDPNAAGRGVTAARIATLTAAIAAFGKVMNTPRGQIVNKSALLRKVETDTAALVQLATDMDDLALQFDGTDAGKGGHRREHCPTRGVNMIDAATSGVATRHRRGHHRD